MAYKGDIVSRLRNWRGLHLSHGGQLYDEAADEIERLRRWIPVAERLPKEGEPVLWHNPADAFCHAVVGRRDGDDIDWGGDLTINLARSVTHWLPIPSPPDGSAPV